MPLYTYVVTFKGDSYVAQARRSNYKGFAADWSSSIPKGSLSKLSPSLADELKKKAYYGEFLAVPNKKNVWHKSIDLGGSVLTVYAVQTDA